MTNVSRGAQQQHTWVRSLPTPKATESQFWISLLPKSEAKGAEKQEKHLLMLSDWETEELPLCQSPPKLRATDPKSTLSDTPSSDTTPEAHEI